MSPNGAASILLVAGASIRKAGLWSDLNEICIEACGHRDFKAGTHPTIAHPVLLYEIDSRLADTFQFLDHLSRAQSDLCIILLGGEIGTAAVAQLLRRGAFDYLTWPCSAERVAESVAAGVVTRRTFLEVRNLSEELARTNQALAHERDVLSQWNRNLSILNQLTQALAGSLDPEAIVKTLFGGLRHLVRADVVGLVRMKPTGVWTCAQPRHQSRETELRRRLLGRVEPRRRLRLLRPLPVTEDPLEEGARTDGTPPACTTCDMPLAIGPQSLGMLHVERDGVVPFTEQEEQLLTMVGGSLALTLRNADSHHQLRHLATRDPLTNVLNRRSLEGPLAREVKAGLRYGTPACLLFLDLDYFKTVNDLLGHLAGDEVLRRVAALVQDTVRDVDSVGRYGGEEFAVVLPHTDLTQAQILAERLRATVERHAFDVPDGHVRLTTSIGLAALQGSGIHSVAEWMAAADTALYAAKMQGRNRVVTYAPIAGSPAEAAAMNLAA